MGTTRFVHRFIMGGDSNFLIDFLAGGISGAIAKTCTAPIERVKLIIQTQDANPRIMSGEIPRYTGIVNCFTRVGSEQGIAAFWRGNFVNILRYFPTQAFNFAFKETIKGPKGFLSLYNGFGVSVLGIIPFRGTYFGVNDTLVGMIPKDLKNDHGFKGIAAKFGCAQTAALCAAYASYAFDTVRRRLQMQSEKPPEEWVYKGSGDCLAKIMKEEGFAALFKGAGANALRTVGSALVLVLYGEIKAMFG